MCGGGRDLVWVSPVRVEGVLGRRGVGVCHELRQGVYWHREHDGAVVLSRDAVQSLEVPQLRTCEC